MEGSTLALALMVLLCCSLTQATTNTSISHHAASVRADAQGNLHLNGADAGRVFVNGTDVFAELASLRETTRETSELRAEVAILRDRLDELTKETKSRFFLNATNEHMMECGGYFFKEDSWNFFENWERRTRMSIHGGAWRMWIQGGWACFYNTNVGKGVDDNPPIQGWKHYDGTLADITITYSRFR